MPDVTARHLFSFGAFEADPAAGELRKHGMRVKLHAQPFQILVMLLERPNELVTREEMRQRLWADGTFVDFDHGLNSAINKIREALNDSAARPRYIETVAGKGYRFIAQVARVEPAAPLSEPEAPVSDSPVVSSVLSTVDELPAPPRRTVRMLLIGVQALYLGIYLTALANLREVDDLCREAGLPVASLAVIVATAAMLIPVRLYIGAAAAFDLRQLPGKFARLFPVLLLLDTLWALSPFLLTHYISAGFALGMTAILVYLPFAQRSLVLMYGRERSA
ncbi:MAG TPA: winged helix-turn-helix domain-containing protein [Bryobacteraceae bacterium]|nr:winged helix-turn-helix domain-containing protein [Bryobacteraceae bacterium]